MRMNRLTGLYYQGFSVPSFAELFAKVGDFKQAGRSGTSTGTITLTPSELHDGETWYLFFCVGSSMEIARIDMTSSSMTKTSLRLVAPGSDTTYASSLNAAGTSIVSNDGVYSGNMSLVWFGSKISPDVIDYMFKNATIGTLKSYYNPSNTNTDANLQVAKSTITAKSGIVFASFRDVPSSGTAAAVFGVAGTQTPGTKIVCCIGAEMTGSSSFASYSPLREITSSGTAYMVPTRDGSINARVRSYTLKYLTETW